MATDFLDNLKKAVENGEFNSEAAKKINDIDKQADIAKKQPIPDEFWNEVRNKVKTENINIEEAIETNSDYEKKMLEIKEKDLILHHLTILYEMDETIRLSIHDMLDFIKSLEEKFDKENSNCKDLFNEIDLIKSRYNIAEKIS